MKKKLFLAILTVLLILPVYQVKASWPDNNLHITFCDIGQGDATLISYKFHQILIDGGPDDKVMTCLEENIPFWDFTIDLVVATHSDADHITGLESVLKSYDVNLIMAEISSKNTDVVTQFNDEILSSVQSGTHLLVPQAGRRLSIAQKIVINILWPLEEKGAKKAPKSQPTETILSDKNIKIALENSDNIVKNNRSIVLNLQFGKTRVFLPGDLEKEGEQALVERGVTKDVDILKTPHHGSKTSSTPKILGQLRPEIAVISSGKNNQFGHPSPQVLQALEAVNAKIMRTDHEGSITISTDGVHYWLED